MNKFKVNGNKNISNGFINAKLGLSNKNNHSTFYLEGKIFVSPSVSDMNCKTSMNIVESNCRTFIKNKLISNNNLTNNFITNFEVCSDRMDVNKKSYLSFQYYFKQNSANVKGILDVKKENRFFFEDLLDKLENELKKEGFIVYNSKG